MALAAAWASTSTRATVTLALAAVCNEWLDKADLRVRQVVATPGTDALRAVDFSGWNERDA